MAIFSARDRMSLAHSKRKPVTIRSPIPGPAPASAPWSAEASDRLKTLLEVDRMSAAQAARVLGVTRNAVIGKAWRLGVAFARQPDAKKPKDMGETLARLALNLKRDAERKARAAEELRSMKMPIAAQLEPPVMGPGDHKTFFDDIRSEHCRWSVGEIEGHRGRHFFCCAPVNAGSSYCPYHHAIAYQAGSRAPVKPVSGHKRAGEPLRLLEAAE